MAASFAVCEEYKGGLSLGNAKTLSVNKYGFGYSDTSNDVGGGSFSVIVARSYESRFSVESTGDKEKGRYVVTLNVSNVESRQRGPGQQSSGDQKTIQYILNGNEKCDGGVAALVLGVKVAKVMPS